MAFGAITTLFFPVTANAGASLWGTDVRKLITPADAGNDASTKFAMGTNTAAHTVTADPYTSQTLDLAQADYGWAIQPTDMGSVAGAQRFMAAGNHVGSLRLQSTTNTNPNGSLTMFVYRVGPAAGRARTLLGSATVTGQTFDTTIRTYTITVALAAVTFAADETIQYSFELNGQGVAVTGKNNSFYCGTITAIPAKIDFPTLDTILDTTGTAAGTSTVAGVGGLVLAGTGTAGGGSTVVGVGAGFDKTTGTASGTSTVAGVGAGVTSAIGTAGGTSVVSGVAAAVDSATGAAGGTSTVTGVAAGTTPTVGSADGSSTVVGIGGSTVSTTGTAGGSCTVDGVGGTGNVPVPVRPSGPLVSRGRGEPVPRHVHYPDVRPVLEDDDVAIALALLDLL